MIFKSEMVKFMEADDTLLARADGQSYEIGSAMNDDYPDSGGYNPEFE